MNQTMLFMACGRETGNWLTTLTTSVRSFHFSPPVIYDCRKCRVKGTEFLNIMNSGWIYIWSFQSSDLGFLPTLNMMLGCWRLNSRIKNPLFEYLWFGCERLNEAFVLIGRCRNRLQFKNQTRRISFSFLFTALDCILNFVKLQIVEGPAFKRSLNATHVHGARCTVHGCALKEAVVNLNSWKTCIEGTFEESGTFCEQFCWRSDFRSFCGEIFWQILTQKHIIITMHL